MERFFGSEGESGTSAAMTERVIVEAKRAFGDRADELRLEQCAREAVAGLWRDSIAVTAFVPVLALRHVREMLESDPRGTVRASSRG
jgi:hypothetical protein